MVRNTKCTNKCYKIAPTGDCSTTQTQLFTAKCLHISASVQHFNHACGERLRSCISILVSARKRPQSAHYTRLSGSAPVSSPLCHLAFASETQRGERLQAFILLHSLLHFASVFLFLAHLCKCLAKQATPVKLSPFTGNIQAALKFVCENDFLLFVSFVCASFFLPSPSFSLFPLQRTR